MLFTLLLVLAGVQSVFSACVPVVLSANVSVVTVATAGCTPPVSLVAFGVTTDGNATDVPVSLGFGCTVEPFRLDGNPIPVSFCSMPAGVTATVGSCLINETAAECFHRVAVSCQLACCATQMCCASGQNDTSSLDYQDLFAQNGYDGSTGRTDWALAPWTEAFYPDDDNLPGSGRIYVVSSELFFDCTTMDPECSNGHPFLVSRAIPMPPVPSCDCEGVLEMNYELVGDPVYVSIANTTVIELVSGLLPERGTFSASCSDAPKIVIAWPSNNTCNGINYFGTWNVTVTMRCTTQAASNYSVCSACGDCPGGSCADAGAGAGAGGAGRSPSASSISVPAGTCAGSHTYGGPALASASAMYRYRTLGVASAGKSRERAGACR